MKRDNLPDDIIKIIFKYRRLLTSENKIVTLIQKNWRKYRIKVLFGRFFMLRYLKDFREWNPDIITFLSKSKL